MLVSQLPLSIPVTYNRVRAYGIIFATSYDTLTAVLYRVLSRLVRRVATTTVALVVD